METIRYTAHKRKQKIRCSDALKLKDCAAGILKTLAPKRPRDPLPLKDFMYGDLLLTSLGTGKLCGYRLSDKIFVVSFDWGQGFFHAAFVQPTDQKKRHCAALLYDLEH